MKSGEVKLAISGKTISLFEIYKNLILGDEH